MSSEIVQIAYNDIIQTILNVFLYSQYCYGPRLLTYTLIMTFILVFPVQTEVFYFECYSKKGETNAAGKVPEVLIEKAVSFLFLHLKYTKRAPREVTNCV